MDLPEKVKMFSQLVINGESVKAMEQYYSESVTMQENEDEPRKGRDACIDHEMATLKKTRSVAARLLNQAVDEVKGIVFSEWKYLFISHTGTTLKLTEISIQQWSEGLISREKFYYKEIRKIERV